MTVTRHQVLFTFKLFKLCDILHIYPVTFDPKSAKFSYEKSIRTTAIHGIFFGNACIKCCHLVHALTRKLVSHDDSDLAVTILTGLWGSLCLTSTFWSYELFHRGLPETLILFNSLDFARPGHHDMVGPGRRKAKIAKKLATIIQSARSFNFRGLVQKILAMDIQELLMVASPYAVTMFVPICIVIVALFPHWPVFSTSLVEPGTLPYWFAVAMETVTVVFMTMNINFLYVFELALQVIHLGSVDRTVKNRGVIGFKGKKDSLEHVDKCIEYFNYLHVFVKLCNVLFYRILFTGKLMALSCSIFGTYFVMTHIDSASAILLLFFGALSVQAIGFYVISCKKLFEFPGAMGAVKNLCATLLDLEKGKITPFDLKLRQYKMKAMPLLGISDGGFRDMNSMSTLEFIDFYLNQVISLLIM